MRKWLNQLSRSLTQRLATPQVKALTSRIVLLEEALTQSKAKNQELARQLNQQREKTRELYAKTKDYAVRLNSNNLGHRER